MTTITCPQSLPWCTDHFVSAAAEDECHRTFVSTKAPLIEITQHPGQAPSVGWTSDGDAEDGADLRRVSDFLLAAAELLDEIKAGSHPAAEVLPTKVWVRDDRGVLIKVSRDTAKGLVERLRRVSDRA